MKPLLPVFLTFLTYVTAGFLPTGVVPGSVGGIHAVQPVSYSAPLAYPQAYTYSQQLAYPQPLAYAQPLSYAQPSLPYSSPIYSIQLLSDNSGGPKGSLTIGACPDSPGMQSFTHPVYYTSPLLSAPVVANHHPQSTVSIVTPPHTSIPHFPQLPAVPQLPQLPQSPQYPQQQEQPQIPQSPQGPSQGGSLPVEPADDSNTASGPQFPQAQQPTFSPPPSEGTLTDEDSVSIEAAIR